MQILRLIKGKIKEDSNNSILEKEYKKNLSYAKKIQMSLILKEFPKSDKYEFYGYYLPAETLGGDIFDIKILDNQYVAFYIADVAGHGIAAAMLTVFVRQSIEMTSTVFRRNIINSPKQVIDNLNKKLIETKFEGSPQVTIFYCILDIETLTLTYSSAGHHPAVLIRDAEKSPVLIGRPSLPVGWFEKINIYENTFELKQNDKLILFTDGIFELMETKDYEEAFNNFTEIIVANKNLTIKKLLSRIVETQKKIGEYTQLDDIAILGLEIK